MATKKFEWKLALDAAGVSKSTKGVEKEIRGMKKSFESLSKISVFTEGQADLKKLEKQLVSARGNVSKLAESGKKSGAALESAYKSARASVKLISGDLLTAKASAKKFTDEASKKASEAAGKYNEIKTKVLELTAGYRKARAEAKTLAESAKKGTAEQKKSASEAKIKVAELAVQLAKAKKESKELGAVSKEASNKSRAAQSKVTAEVKELSSALAVAKQKSAEAGKAVSNGAKGQQAAYKKAAAEVDELTKSVRTQTGVVAKNSAGLKASGVNTKKITEEQKRAELAYKSTSTELKAAAKVQQQFDTLGIRSSKAVRAEQAARVKARKKLAASGKASAADLVRADKAIAAGAKKAAAELSSSNNKGAKSYQNLAAAAGGFFAVQRAGAAALGAVKFYADFDDKLRETKAAAGATAAEFELLKQKAIELGKSPGLTPTDMAAGMAEAARAGQDVNEILESVAANAELTAGSELEFGEAVELTTDILAQFGRGASETQNLVDVLIAGANSASVKVGQLGEAYSYAGATSDALGISTNKVAAQFLVLANSSLKAERGGTALRAVWNVLLTKQDQIKDFGVDVTKIEDGKEVVRDLADIIDDLAEAELSAVERTEVFGKIAGPGISVLLKKGGDAIRGYEEKLDNAAGAGKRVSKILQEGIGGKGIRATESSFQILVINLVESVLPALEKIGAGIAATIRIVSDVPKPVLATSVALGAMATAFIGVTAAVASWAIIGPIVSAAAASVIAFSAASYAAVAAVAAVAAPIVVIYASIATLVVALKKGIEAYKAHEMAANAAAKASEGWAKFEKKRQAASAAAGYELKTWRDIQDAYKKGAIDYNDLTGEYTKGSGIPRKVAAEHKEAADTVQGAAEKSSAAVKKSAEIQEISLADAKKEWLDYASQIKDIDEEIESIGGFGGGNVSGLQQINGEWQYLATNADKAKSAMQDYNNTALLGLSSVADTIFDLSLAGKSDIEVWNARKRAAEQYTEAAKSTAEEAKQLAGAGQQDEANRKFAQSIEITKKAEAAYKSLATEVKGEWTPAMDAAHKSAAEGVKKYEKEADKALSAAAKHYDKARAAGEKLADRQLNLAEKLRDIKLAGKGPVAAYEGMASAARKYEADAERALAAGDFEKAISLADRATSAWDGLGNEVKEGERVAISSRSALAAQASGVKSAGEIAIQALKAQQAEEEKAGKAAEEKAARAMAAKEAEAKKVNELEAEKEKVIISAEAGAQEAAAGTLEANQLVVDILEEQKTAIGEVADALNKQADWSLGEAFTDAGESLKTFDTALNDFDGNWGEVWDSMRTKGEEDIEAIASRLDKLVAEKRVITLEIKEVSGASGGTVAGVSGASTGTIVGRLGQYGIKDGASGFRVPGWGGGDSLRHLYALEGGEPVTNKHSARHFDYPFFNRINKGDEVGAAKSLVDRFPHIKKVFGEQSLRSVRPINFSPQVIREATPSSATKNSLPGNLMHITVIDQVDGVQYEKFMTPDSFRMEQAREHRRQNINSKLQR